MADFAPTRTTYASTTPVWARDLLKSENHGVLLDSDAFLAAFPDGVLPSGLVIAVTTSTDLGGPYDPAFDADPATAGVQADGRDTAVGHLINETKVVAGGRDLQAVLHAGTVTRRLLPANSGMDDAAKADLPAIVYI